MNRCERFMAALFLCAWAVGAVTAGETTAIARSETLEVKYDAESRTLEVSDRQLGKILEGGAVRAKIGPRTIGTDQPGVEVAKTKAEAGNAAVDALTLAVAGGGTVNVAVRGDQVTIATSGGFPADAVITFGGRAAMGPDARVAILRDAKSEDRHVLLTTLGPARVPGARSLFDPLRDLAVTAAAADGGGLSWEPGTPWDLHARAPAGSRLLCLSVQRHYYRDTLGIKYYAPMPRVTRWPTAPVVAMTWYGIKGWEGRPAQRKEWLFPNVDWVASHLLPYAGDNLVFQLDDNYPFGDDKMMRELSDYIRSKGLVPGIWFTPFAVAPRESAAQHPDWFLHGAKHELLRAFGGVNWGWHGDFRNSAGVLNATNPEAVENQYGMFWCKASQTWNFDFFKIDGQPAVAAAYAKSIDGRGLEGYRKGLEIGRRSVGPDKFINGCWGTPVDGIGWYNGSRTGGDTGNKPHAIDVVLRFNFLNNVCWFSDPDAAANLYGATVERTRLNAQARVLTGQQFLTDDVWTDVPPAICRVWQLSFPMLDIHPVGLYKIDDWSGYDLFDLRVGAPWGTREVVGLFNFQGKPAEKDLDLGRLPPENGRFHVFEFWSSEYLGEYERSAKIPRRLAPYEGQAFAVVPARDDRPVLLSTSRHVTQGALELEKLVWKQENRKWTATGTSSHLVAGDAYELVFAGQRFHVAGVNAAAPAAVSRSGGVMRVKITPEQSGSAVWQVVFEPITGAQLGVSCAAMDVRQGDTGSLDIESLGPRPAKFKVQTDLAGLKVSPAQGQLGPSPARAKITVSAEALRLAPGTVVTAKLTILSEGGGQTPEMIEVRVHAPPPPEPENLAPKAKATASSVWSDDYGPSRATDHDPSTRWNSKRGDQDGCWLELTWPAPVEFDRVEIDECTDWGQRIKAWHLEAGTDPLVPIAKGQGAGRHHVVKLPKPVKAARLRLTVDQASDVPTIWELKVYRSPANE